RQRRAVLPRQLPQPVRRRRRARLHRVALQVALDVAREPVGRLVPAGGGVFPRPPPPPIPDAPPPAPPAAPPRPPRRPPLLAAAGGGAARGGGAPPEPLSGVDGLGGSPSLIRRRISPYAACRSRSCSSGVVPVSNS